MSDLLDRLKEALAGRYAIDREIGRLYFALSEYESDFYVMDLVD